MHLCVGQVISNLPIIIIGTGGTIAGISKYLKKCNKSIKIYLVDPPGSSLYNRVKFGVLYSSK